MMLDCFALVALTGTECKTNKIFDSSYSPLLRTASYLFRLISHKCSWYYTPTHDFPFFGESYHTHTHPHMIVGFSGMNMSSNKKKKDY